MKSMQERGCMSEVKFFEAKQFVKKESLSFMEMIFR